MENELNIILEPEEKIVWQDVINRKVMTFNLIISIIVIIVISFILFSKNNINYMSNDVSKTISGSTLALWFFVITLFFTFLNFFSNYVKKYAITNKRVLIKSGLIGTDFNSIYFTEVKSVNVNVGLIGKIFSVGTINIDTGKLETVSTGNGKNQSTSVRTAYDKIVNINNPYEVYKYFQTTLTNRQESLYSGRADKNNANLTQN